MAFFALMLPKEARQAVTDGLAPLRTQYPHWHWVHPDDYHLTLRFLGGKPSHQLQNLLHGSAVAAPAAPLLHLIFSGLDMFERRHGSGILWLGLQHVPPELSDLRQALDRWAVLEGFAQEDKPFVPHVTVARFAEQEAPHLAERLRHGSRGIWPSWTVASYALMRRKTAQNQVLPEPLYEVLDSIECTHTA